MTDYQKVAKAIDFIRSNVNRQPTLDEIAAQVHLSAYHFHRIFSRWAGVSPKRFLQVLTLQQAKTLLQDSSASVLDISNTIGLSSSSRLYDHFVNIEAVTPSQYKQGGMGLDIFYGIHDTPFGSAFIAITTRGICQFVFVETQTIQQLLDDLQLQWPRALLIQDAKQTLLTVNAMFNKTSSAPEPLSLWVRGTNFQISVWQALLSIEQGQLASYGGIAKAIGKPKAARAVGTAVGANPIAFVIPCHRVIQQSGMLGGYRWGETRKHAMLVRELAMQN